MVQKIQERGLIEEQDAEELMNDVDIEMEAEFDQNLVYYGRGGLGTMNATSTGLTRDLSTSTLTNNKDLTQTQNNFSSSNQNLIGQGGVGEFLMQYNLRKSSQGTAVFAQNMDSANHLNKEAINNNSGGLSRGGSHLNMRIGSGNYFKKSGSGNTNHNSHSSFNYEIKQVESYNKANMKLADMNVKIIEHDFMDLVPANCCLLEIKSIFDIKQYQPEHGRPIKPKDTIFMGTYDGQLHSLRLETKKEGQVETLVLNHLRKWSFSYPITSMITFDFFNQTDPDQLKNKNQLATQKQIKQFGNLQNLSISQSNQMQRTILVGKGSEQTQNYNQSSTQNKIETNTQASRLENGMVFNHDFYHLLMSSYQAQNDFNKGEDLKPSQALSTTTSKIAKKTLLKNYQNMNIINLLSQMQFNDSLMIVGLANNTVLPLCYSTKINSDGENLKQLADVAQNISEFSKPYLAKITSKKNSAQIHENQSSQDLTQNEKKVKNKPSPLFAVATNDGNLLTLKAYQTQNKEDSNIDQQLCIKGLNNLLCMKKDHFIYHQTFMSISSETIFIKLVDLNNEELIKNEVEDEEEIDQHRYLQVEALVLVTYSGTIYFQLLKQPQGLEHQIPQLFVFESELRLKAAKVGDLRLYGSQEKAQHCLFLFTYEDFALIYYDFVFEINTQHISFKQHKKNLANGNLALNRLESTKEMKSSLLGNVKSSLIRDKSKNIKNPIILRLMNQQSNK
eukprot:403373557